MDYKFKIGDEVRVLDGSDINNYTYGWTPTMKRFVGNVYRIVDYDSERLFHTEERLPVYHLDLGSGITGCYIFDERGLEHVNPVYLDSNELLGFLNGGE